MERYRVLPFERYHLGFNEELVQLLTDEHSMLLPGSASMTLQLCRNFKTLEEHAVSICRALKMQYHESGKISRTLTQLIERELLISEGQLYASISASNEPQEPISAIAILTANRVTQCLTSLGSFAQNAEDFSRRPVFRIMDDSSSPEISAALVHQLQDCAIKSPVLYAGKTEKRMYVRELEKLGINGSVARFALLGENEDALPTIGANRNCILFDTIGENVLSVDDDIVCRTAPHPSPSGQIRICSHEYPRDIWFFNDRQEVLDKVQWQSIDLLQQHERLLGRLVGDLLLETRTSAGTNLEDMCDHMLISLLNGAARVRATVGGIAGDSGAKFPMWMLASSGRTRANLLASESVYRTALNSRELLGTAHGPTISHHPFSQTATIGLDNRRPLPPFFPVSRGEDTIWGVLAMSISPHCFFGHVPFALLHDAEPGRAYEKTFQYRIAELMIPLLSSYSCSSGASSLDPLRQLGSYLRDISALPDKDFWNWVVHSVRTHNSYWMPELQAVLNTFDQCPDYWERAIREWHSQMATFLVLATFALDKAYACFF
jgi:hypothetical protein